MSIEDGTLVAGETGVAVRAADTFDAFVAARTRALRVGVYDAR
ncbi:hypothetical protein ACIBL3_12760 [Kribbella sp. NPDC050124]